MDTLKVKQCLMRTVRYSCSGLPVAPGDLYRDPLYAQIMKRDPSTRQQVIGNYLNAHPMPYDKAYDQTDLIIDLNESFSYYGLPAETELPTVEYIINLLQYLMKKDSAADAPKLEHSLVRVILYCRSGCPVCPGTIDLDLVGDKKQIIKDYLKGNPMPLDEAYNKTDLMIDLVDSFAPYTLPAETKDQTADYVLTLMDYLIVKASEVSHLQQNGCVASTSVVQNTQEKAKPFTGDAVHLDGQAINGLGMILNLINNPGEINITYDNIMSLIFSNRMAVSLGIGEGEGGAAKAGENAVEHLLGQIHLFKAMSPVIVHVGGSTELHLKHVHEAVDAVKKALPDGTEVIFGVRTQDILMNGVRDDRVYVTVIASEADQK